LISGGAALEATECSVSSVMDTWILLRAIESGGERNRALYVLKSRGMPHSEQVREFVMTPQGVELMDVYLGPDGVLTGSARLSREAQERTDDVEREYERERRRLVGERKRTALEAQIAAIQAELAAENYAVDADAASETRRLEQRETDREIMALSRSADADAVSNPTLPGGEN